MMESNPKQRTLTYNAIRKLKYLCVSFRYLYDITDDEKYKKRYQDLYEILQGCLDDFCADIEDLFDCRCLCEAGFDAEFMQFVDDCLYSKQMEAADECRN